MQSNRVESPCVSMCCLNPDDICMGCFRHLEEIKGWLAMDDNARKQVLERCKQRQQGSNL